MKEEKLEEAKRLYETANADQKYVLESLYPELKESEDEKVRKEIVEYLKKNLRLEWATWLEKQGEEQPIIRWHSINEEPEEMKELFCEWESDDATWHDVAFYDKESHTFRHAKMPINVTKWIYVDELLEKQGEQKPADKVEPKCEESKTKIFDAPTPFEDKLYAFVAACEFLAIPSKIEFILEHSQEILDAAREQIGKERKTAWSEEDETGLTNTIIMLKEGASLHFIKKDITKAVDWLKSLKTKVQPKQEWSEKDEEELEIAIDTLKESGRYDSAKWVQSLKQRIGE